MSATPSPSFDLDVVPLAVVGDADLVALVDGLPGAAAWHGQLLHPSRPVGLAAVVDGGVVGVARVVRRTDAGRQVLVAVAEAWRHQGIGARLWCEAVALVEAAGDTAVPAVEAPSATVHRLPRRARLHASDALAGLSVQPGRVA